MGAGGLGVSLSLMRVNKKPLKRALQALFSTGLAAALYLVAAQQVISVIHRVSMCGFCMGSMLTLVLNSLVSGLGSYVCHD